MIEVKNTDTLNKTPKVCKILICGGRHFDSYEMLRFVVDDIITNTETDTVEIVSGHCQGADMLGEQYAKENDYALKIFPADWKKYGRSAGPIRNKQMIDYISSTCENPIVVAFKSENSKGTANTIALAKKKQIPVYEIPYTLDSDYFTLDSSDWDLINEGVNFDTETDNFTYDWEHDADDDFIKLDTSYHCYSKEFNGCIRYYGYRINNKPDNADARKKFLKYVKSPIGVDDNAVKELIYRCIEDFVDRYDISIPYVVQVATTSQFSNIIYNEYKKYVNNCTLITTSKISPESFEIDWDAFDRDNSSKSKEYYSNFKNYLEKMFSSLKSKYQKDGNISISSVKPRYRKYIKQIFKFNSDNIDWSDISNILIIDDTFTKGFSFSSVIKLLRDYGYEGDISVLSIFDNH